jgi:hypothetical protein
MYTYTYTNVITIKSLLHTIVSSSGLTNPRAVCSLLPVEGAWRVACSAALLT